MMLLRRGRFGRDIEGSANRIPQALDELRVSRANFVQRCAQAGGQFVRRLEPIFSDGWKAARFGQSGEDEFHRLAAVEKRSPDRHGSSRQVVRLAAVFGNFPADEDGQRTHEINQVRLARIARVDLQQVQQFGENISADAAQLAVLEVKRTQAPS